MCGRFTLTIHHFEDVVASLGAAVDPAALAGYRPRYNIAPGQPHWILRSEASRRELVGAFWGLINHWATDPSVGCRQINARAETLAQRPAFRDALAKRRCVLPADGFYEWHGPKSDRRPIWFHAPDRSLLLMAGLYEDWREPDSGQLRTTFTIITTDASEPVKAIHHRMPALLESEQIDRWLSGDEPGALLGPAPADRLVGQPASRRVNKPANDDPDCLVADEPPRPEPEAQLDLFASKG